jgi:hypothetical protein
LAPDRARAESVKRRSGTRSKERPAPSYARLFVLEPEALGYRLVPDSSGTLISTPAFQTQSGAAFRPGGKTVSVIDRQRRLIGMVQPFLDRPGLESKPREWIDYAASLGYQRIGLWGQSLGAVLFTTLTGRAPFHGQTPGEVYSAHLNQPVPPLAAADPGLHRQLQSLDFVIQRAMAKRPEDRYSTPLLFADAVESTLAQAQKGLFGKSRRQSVWSLGNDNPLTFNEAGMPVLAGQAGPPSQMGGVPAGSLQSLNFRKPTSVGGLNGLMEDGYIGGNWNDDGAQGGLRIPAPAGPPVSPMVPPPMAAPPMAPQR